jgi:hypothetical protein
MNQPNPAASATNDIPVAEVTNRGRINIPFSKKNVSTDDVAATTKSVKDKVKTGLALVGAVALGIGAAGVIAKRRTGDDTITVALPSIDTTSSDAPTV